VLAGVGLGGIVSTILFNVLELKYSSYGC
jgi:hypothetical protein